MCDHDLAVSKVLSTYSLSLGSRKLYEGKGLGLVCCCSPTWSRSGPIVFVKGPTFNFCFFPPWQTPAHPSGSMKHGHCHFLMLLPTVWGTVILSSVPTQLLAHTVVIASPHCIVISTFLSFLFTVLLAPAPQRQGPLCTHVSATGFLLRVGSQQVLCRYLNK